MLLQPAAAVVLFLFSGAGIRAAGGGESAAIIFQPG